jgi:hypothetical protein
LTSVGGLQREATPLTPTNTFEITNLTRVEMLLLIAQQHQAATAKSFVARQSQTMIGEPAHAKTATYKSTSTSMNSRKLQVAKGHESLV